MHKIFISYSHQDEAWKDRLVTQLRVLQQQIDLEIWDDRRIAGGDDWQAEITQALRTCNMAVLLNSANFLTSKFILEEEVPRLLQRRQNEGVRVIPLIVKPCPWQNIGWLKLINARPKDGRPLSGGNEHQIDTDLAALADEITGLLKHAGHAPGAMPAAPLPPDKIQTAKLPATTSTLFGREKELQGLDEAWADEHTHLLSLVAWGGVGKTALVNEWLSRLERDHFRGAERVFGWSFYSQGTKEERNVSADTFFNEALLWFGQTSTGSVGAPILSPWDKGVRLAELVRQQKTLLILDGVEPLQYPPGTMQGELKDQGLKALLKELARSNLGLCLVTTRVALKDIGHTEGKTARRVELENLSPEAGSRLLQHLGVKGTPAELAAAAQEFGGHALALTLLGRYLAVVHKGEIRKRDLIPHLTAEEEQGGHARRVMESYERWLAGRPECNILYLIGLFDRPAAAGALAALRAAPVIAGLTHELQSLSEAKWQYAVQHLRDLRLLAEDRHDTLDCHPLVREHFGEKLRAENPKAWQEAHRRLYEYYKNLPEKKLPDTLEEMEPLFAAVAHGCQAGRHQETVLEVYFRRIQRDGKTNYCCNKLGAFGADLSAVSNFFEVLWSQPASGLNDLFKAGVLSWAGFRLRALGRLAEAAEPMQAAVDNFVNQKNWLEAAKNAGNLSELYLTLGEVAKAVAAARQSVDYADRSADGFMREVTRTKSGDALHQAGDLSAAEKLFREAEAMQQQRQPAYRYLYSLQGYQFCDLLLSQGQAAEVVQRSEFGLKVARESGFSLLTFALCRLSLGRAHTALSAVEGEDFLNQAVTGLREAGAQHHIPRGLFARAALYRAQGQFAKAAADLEEAYEIAERGGMRLHLADYHLEASRLEIKEQKANSKKQAEEHLAIAKEMIEKMGYGRRKPEVEALQREVESLKI